MRHGSVFVRVSPNRLSVAGGHNKESKSRQNITRGDEFADSDTDGEDENVDQTHSLQNQSPFLDHAASDETRHNAKRRKNAKIELKKDDAIQYKMKDDDEWMTASVTGRGGKLSGGHRNWFNVKDKNGVEKGLNFDRIIWQKCDKSVPEEDQNEPEDVNIVLIPKDQHGNDACVNAKLTELQKLKNFDTYEEVQDCGQFAISTTWVLWHKGDEVRARLVARGYEDPQNYPRDSPTIGKTAMRVAMCLAASKVWNIQTTDIKSAFLQGRKIEQEVFLKPPKELQKEGFLWKLKHCLYGLNDAARHFYQSIADMLRSVGCTECLLDPALFYKHEQGELIGFVACHVDDFLHAGTQSFESTVMVPLRNRFAAGKIQTTAFHYVGLDIMQDEAGITIDQSSYISSLDDIPLNALWSKDREQQLEPNDQRLLRQIVGKLNWAVQGTRPDVAFDLIQLSTKLKVGQVSDLIQAIKCMRKLKNGTSSIRFQNLGPSGGEF